MSDQQQKVGHTAGPWTADNANGEYWAVADSNGSVVACLVEPTPNVYAARYELLPRDEDFELAVANWRHGGIDTPQPRYPNWAEQDANAHLIAAAPDLKAFADSVLIYQVEGDDEHVWLRFGDQHICIMKSNSAEGVALLKMEAARRAAIAKAEGRNV